MDDATHATVLCWSSAWWCSMDGTKKKSKQASKKKKTRGEERNHPPTPTAPTGPVRVGSCRSDAVHARKLWGGFAFLRFVAQLDAEFPGGRKLQAIEEREQEL